MRLVTLAGFTALSLTTACGQDGSSESTSREIPGPSGPAGPSGTSCYVTPNEEGALIECTDGSKAQVNHGKQGAIGPKGDTGQIGPRGDVGERGPAGRDGLAGVDGTPGVAGRDGTPGLPGTQVVPVIPCPTRVGSYPEVLMCIDNRLYAVFVGGSTSTIRYAQVGPGTYTTTDGRSCTFRVTSGCNLEQ